MYLPVVSVVIITYNSSNTIIETLESIKSQTYNNIELVISDDNSSDNTLSVCYEWIENNKTRFVSTVIVSSSSNTGVACNLNRGIEKANGEWIKSMAGDDLLKENAIMEFVQFVHKNSECRICTSTLELFGGKKKDMEKAESELNKKYSVIRNGNREQQYNTSLIRQILPGTGIFYQKSLWEDIGGFDERFPMAEEYPFEIKVLEITKVYLLDKKLFMWRQRNDSLSHMVNSPSEIQLIDFYWNVRRKLLINNHSYLRVFDLDLINLQLKNNKWYFKVIRILSPYTIFRLFSRFF